MSTTVTIHITNVNEPPSLPYGGATIPVFTVSENPALGAGYSIGTLYQYGGGSLIVLLDNILMRL